jgi:chemotaxis protein MotB
MDFIVPVIGLFDNEVAVGAHTQARPVVLADNPVWNLSAERADKVRHALERAGLDGGRIKRVTGHADRSLADVNPMALRNNRIEIIVLRSDR